MKIAQNLFIKTLIELLYEFTVKINPVYWAMLLAFTCTPVLTSQSYFTQMVWYFRVEIYAPENLLQAPEDAPGS